MQVLEKIVHFTCSHVYRLSILSSFILFSHSSIPYTVIILIRIARFRMVNHFLEIIFHVLAFCFFC